MVEESEVALGQQALDHCEEDLVVVVQQRLEVDLLVGRSEEDLFARAGVVVSRKAQRQESAVGCMGLAAALDTGSAQRFFEVALHPGLALKCFPERAHICLTALLKTSTAEADMVMHLEPTVAPLMAVGVLIQSLTMAEEGRKHCSEMMEHVARAAEQLLLEMRLAELSHQL